MICAQSRERKRHACCCCGCWWLPTPIYCPLRFDDDATSLKKRKEKGKTTRGTRHCAVLQVTNRCVSWPPLLNNNNNRRKLYTAISPFGPLCAHTHTSVYSKKFAGYEEKTPLLWGGECNFLGARNSKSSQKEKEKQNNKQNCACFFFMTGILKKKRETGLV
jgi:hypothetical protein